MPMLSKLSCGVYHLGRKAAVELAAGYQRFGEETVRGSTERSDYYNFGDKLSKDELEELEDANLVLETTSYCQEELGVFKNSLRSCRNRDDTQLQAKRLINHDFLILKLSHKHENQNEDEPGSFLYLFMFALVLSFFQNFFPIVLVLSLIPLIIYKLLSLCENMDEDHHVLAYHIGISLFRQVFPLVFQKNLILLVFLYLLYGIISLCGCLEVENQSVPTYYIRAEKVAKGLDSLEGIHLKILEEQEYFEIEPQCCLYRIELCTNIRFLDLKGILEKESSNYDLRKDNCWDYARKTTKYLLEACIDRKREAKCEDYRRLQKELINVEHNIVRYHIGNIVKLMGSCLNEIWD